MREFSVRFDRNIGWTTRAEQKTLGQKRIAIPGLGGVGGLHFITSARFGIGAMNISDPDVCDEVNINRQFLVDDTTIGRRKDEVAAEHGKRINPDLKIEKRWPDGINEANVDEFLTKPRVHACIDSIDAFEIATRRLIAAACSRHKIPLVSAGPIGMGCVLLVFMPGEMTFDDYFGFSRIKTDDPKKREREELLRFFVGIHPGIGQNYLVDASTFDIDAHIGPSTVMGCEICAATAGAEVAKILLNRGKIRSVPHLSHVDAYTSRYRHLWFPGGMKWNPFLWAKLSLGRKMLRAMRLRTMSQSTKKDEG